MPEYQNKVTRFWNELKRRKVVKVIIIYASTAFILIQLCDLVIVPLHLPEWVMTFIIVLLLILFPVVVIISWIFDITPDGLERTPSIHPHTEKKSYSNKKVLILDTIIVVLLVLVAILAYPKIFDKKSSLATTGREDVSIAIMPFENLTGDTNLDFWQQGISEYLLNSLATSDEIKVISSHVVSELMEGMKKSTAAVLSSGSSQEIARLLNAGIYITGSFLGSSSSKSIMINLSNTSTGEVIWSDKVDGDLANNYGALLQKASGSVRNYLELKFLENKVPAEFSNAYPKSAEAYKYYIEGLNHILLGDFNEAIQPLNEAVKIDPHFTFAAFYLTWAYYYNHQYKEANQWLQHAYENRQNLPSQYQPWIDLWYACLISKDRTRIYDSLDHLENSTSKSRFFWYDIGATYSSFLEEYDKAIACFEKVDLLSKDFGEEWEYDDFYQVYSDALLNSGDLGGAIKVAERGLIHNDNTVTWLNCYGAFVILGNTSKIQEGIDKIHADVVKYNRSASTEDRYISYMYATGKDTVKALEFAQKAYDLEPDYLSNAYNLANLLISANVDIDLGLHLVESILENNPEHLLSLWLKGKVLFKTGKYDEALDVMNEIYAKTPSYNGYLESELAAIKQAIRKSDTNS